MKKVLLFAICLAFLSALLFPAAAGANGGSVLSGVCGDGVRWGYNSEDRLLTVYGTGAMYDYEDSFDTPWYEHLGNIRDIVVEEGVTHVGAGAFLWAKNLRGLFLAESVRSIGDYAFGKCVNLYLLTIPEKLDSIGKGAFFMCCNIVDFRIPEGIEEIPDKAFGQCEQLRSVTVPGSVSRIGEEAFMDCSSVLYADIKDGAEVLCSHSFAFCSLMNTVHIPRSVNKIEKFAFSHCDALKDVYFGGTSEEWDSIVEYGDGDDSLKNAEIHYETDEFPIHGQCGESATWEYSAADKTLVIDGTGKMFRYDYGGGAPWRDFSIERIIVKDGITSIGDMAFFQTKGLVSVQISDTVTEIESAAFGFCHTMTDIRLSGSLETVGGGAFASCGKLSSVELPASLTDLDPTAFSGCTGLTSISVDGDNPVYCSVNGCVIDRAQKKLKLMIKEGEIPSDGSVTAIGARSFAACEDIRAVCIPRTVTYVEESAFPDCPLITDVYYEGTEAEWEALKSVSPSGEFSGNNIFFDAQIHFSSSPGSRVAGDATGDGSVDMKDVLLLRKAVAGASELPRVFVSNADLDGDGSLTMKDILMIRRIVAGATV